MRTLETLWLAVETYRLSQHLNRALHWLRSRPAPSPARQQALRLLETYISLKQFPRNLEGSPGYTPIFIDTDGRYCAVGYLVAQTAGPEAAQAIDKQFHLGYVKGEMVEIVKSWGKEHDLGIEELAFVQPGYWGLDHFICNFVVMGLLSVLLCVFFLLTYSSDDQMSVWLFYGSLANLAVQVIQFGLIFLYAKKTNAPLLTATALHCVALVYFILVLALAAADPQADSTVSWVLVSVFGAGVTCCLCPCSVLCFDMRNADFNFLHEEPREDITEPLITQVEERYRK